MIGSGEQVELRSGDLTAVVASVGASLRRLRVGAWDVLDGYEADEPALYAQGQALVPWPNRLAGGRYVFAGREHQLALSEPERGNAIHGLARWRSFQVVTRGEDQATLALELHPQAGYPFALAVEVVASVTPRAVQMRTTARNAGRGALPYGVGFHPYLRVGTERVDDARLTIPAATRLELDDRGIPTGRRRSVADTPYGFRAPRRVGDVELDTPYADLERDGDGRARVRLEAPDGRPAATLWLDEQHPHVMAFTGDGLPDPARRRRSLGLEPMTCPPNAFATGHDLRVLEPGESMTAAWGLELEP